MAASLVGLGRLFYCSERWGEVKGVVCAGVNGGGLVWRQRRRRAQRVAPLHGQGYTKFLYVFDPFMLFPV